MLTVTRKFEFEMAHYLPYHQGRCGHLHGHSYKMEVTVTNKDTNSITASSNSRDPAEGMIVDFQVLKQIVTTEILDIYDHSFTVWEGAITNPSLSEYIDNENNDPNNRINCVDYNPTVENMSIRFGNILSEALAAKNLKLVKLRLYETSNSYADYYPDL